MAAFLAHLRPYFRLVHLPVDPPPAWVTTSAAIVPPGRAPVVAWWQSGDPDPEPDPRRLVVGVDPAAGVLAVNPGLDLSRRPALTPFLRQRWRRREGLPDPMVVVVDGDRVVVDGAGDTPAAARTPAVALASAAVVTGPALEGALSWGTPCVTDAASARALGAVDGVHVVVDEHDPLGRARELAADQPVAAALSRASRRLAEGRDISRWLRPVLGHLGGVGRCGPSGTPLAHRLDELATSPGSRMCERARAAVAGWER